MLKEYGVNQQLKKQLLWDRRPELKPKKNYILYGLLLLSVLLSLRTINTTYETAVETFELSGTFDKALAAIGSLILNAVFFFIPAMILYFIIQGIKKILLKRIRPVISGEVPEHSVNQNWDDRDRISIWLTDTEITGCFRVSKVILQKRIVEWVRFEIKYSDIQKLVHTSKDSRLHIFCTCTEKILIPQTPYGSMDEATLIRENKEIRWFLFELFFHESQEFVENISRDSCIPVETIHTLHYRL